MLLETQDQYRGKRPRTRFPALPEIRPSFLDPGLVCEPWIDECCCEQILILFILNRPIALFPGSSLDHVSLATLLDQLRHRAPRQAG